MGSNPWVIWCEDMVSVIIAAILPPWRRVWSNQRYPTFKKKNLGQFELGFILQYEESLAAKLIFGEFKNKVRKQRSWFIYLFLDTIIHAFNWVKTSFSLFLRNCKRNIGAQGRAPLSVTTLFLFSRSFLWLFTTLVSSYISDFLLLRAPVRLN